jgi:hypothetical protein
MIKHLKMIGKINKSIFWGLILIFLFSCEKDRYKYFIGSFPETPVNLTTFNTEFDDYNSDIPILGETFPLCFSSTRNSSGLNYDIIYKLMTISFSKTSGKLDIYENLSSNLDVYIENANINNALSKINTSSNEFGPYLISKGKNFNGTNMNKRFEMYIFLYSNNSSGNQDIKFTQNLQNEFYEQPIDIKFLNSKFDDAYPTFNIDFSEIYFTSNRENDFNIYRASIDKKKDLIDFLTNTSQVPIQKDTVLSSKFDDKCPYISNNFIVFTSNREGGFGGYDLYYSRFENGKWSEPQNFGDKINTSYDEYRPIVRPQAGFTNDFMIFSSNRPGGKGGFDLYYVGIEKIINNK